MKMGAPPFVLRQLFNTYYGLKLLMEVLGFPPPPDKPIFRRVTT